MQTLTQFTGISINHYARVDFTHVSALVNAVGGIDVTVPTATTDYGYSFPQGVNHLTGVTAVYYARDPLLTSQDRLERQENLFRTLITTVARRPPLHPPRHDGSRTQRGHQHAGRGQ